MSATISTIAHYIPSTIIENSYFENYLDTSDAWIVKRTGIKQRRFYLEGPTSDMIIPAAKKVLTKRKIKPKEIDCILVCTVTPDFSFPSTACVVQEKLGCKNAWGYDISAACSSFLYGLQTASSFINSGLAKKVLLCGADKMTSILNLNDRNQAVLFGDGAAVCLIEESDDPKLGIIDADLHINGEGGKYLKKIAGGSFLPAWNNNVKPEDHYIYQDGQPVFKNAVSEMSNSVHTIMKRNKISVKDLTWLVPHQANMRIIKAVGERAGIPDEKVAITVDKLGNTTAATIPTALSILNEERKLRRGDNIILTAFGGGFTWGAMYLRWNSL
jgi:3-oxoacyl-[acyl-carrier-protein] synthase-3